MIRADADLYRDIVVVADTKPGPQQILGRAARAAVVTGAVIYCRGGSLPLTLSEVATIPCMEWVEKCVHEDPKSCPALAKVIPYFLFPALLSAWQLRFPCVKAMRISVHAILQGTTFKPEAYSMQELESHFVSWILGLPPSLEYLAFDGVTQSSLVFALLYLWFAGVSVPDHREGQWSGEDDSRLRDRPLCTWLPRLKGMSEFFATREQVEQWSVAFREGFEIFIAGKSHWLWRDEGPQSVAAQLWCILKLLPNLRCISLHLDFEDRAHEESLRAGLGNAPHEFFTRLGSLPLCSQLERLYLHFTGLDASNLEQWADAISPFVRLKELCVMFDNSFFLKDAGPAAIKARLSSELPDTVVVLHDYTIPSEDGSRFERPDPMASVFSPNITPEWHPAPRSPRPSPVTVHLPNPRALAGLSPL